MIQLSSMFEKVAPSLNCVDYYFSQENYIQLKTKSVFYKLCRKNSGKQQYLTMS